MTTDKLAPDYDKSIHTNPDALAWAKFFMETWEKLDKPEPEEGWMLSWFANAMMAQHDSEVPRLIAEVERLREALRELTDAIESGLCNSGTPAADPPERLDMAMTVARAALEPKP